MIKRELPVEAETDSVAFLHAHGLDVEPKRLNDLVKQAIASLPGRLHRVDPREELPPDEIELLQRGGLQFDAEREEDPLGETVAGYAALIANSYTAGEVAEKLGVDSSRVRQRINSRSLYAFKINSQWRLPAFQFDRDGNELPGMAQVARALDGTLHPVAVLRWFTSPDSELLATDLSEEPLSPQQWLMAGQPPQAVAQIAADL